MDETTTLATAGAGAYILGPLGKRLANLLGRLLGPGVDEIGLAICDKVREFRFANQVKVLVRAQEICENAKIPFSNAAKSFLVPLLDAAGNVDSAELQELFARLLSSGLASQSAQHPRFIEALKQMTPQDARLLAHAAEFSDDFPPPPGPSESEVEVSASCLHGLGLLVYCFSDCDWSERSTSHHGARVTVGGVNMRLSPVGRALCTALMLTPDRTDRDPSRR